MNNSKGNVVSDVAKKFIKKKIILLLLGGVGSTFSAILTALPLFIALLVVLGIISGGDSNGLSCVSTQTVGEVCKSISVNGETMSVDDYVAHVITKEFGGAPEETLKAQAIAARSYGVAGAKKDSQGNCVISDTSEGFQTYAATASERSIQAAKDTSGMVLLNKDGNVARAEYSSNSLTKAYGSFGNTIIMSERDLEIPRDWYSKNKTCSDDSLNKANSNKDAYGRTVYGCGHGRGMGQIAAKYLAEEKNYTYDQIIEYFYGKDSPYQWTLGSPNGSSSNCGSSLTTLDHYTLGHAGLNVLNRTLSSSEISDLNSYLEQEIAKAGRGSGAAVAAAGQGLVYWLEQKKYYLQYRWGGGHSGFGDGNSTFIGANPNWGSDKYGVDNNGGTNRKYLGMDCSGFVSWATRMACKSSFGSETSGSWESYGSGISLSEAKPGDVIASASHIQLIVKNNKDGSVYVAESAGSPTDGLVFSKLTSTSSMVVSMQKWYANNCENITPPVNNSGSSGNSSSSSSNTGGNLKKKINSYLSNSATSGTWAVYVKNLKTGETVNINANKQMNSASSIKLFVLASAYDKVKRGKVVESSFKANARNMIVYSDNSATNNVIDTIGGMSVVNSYVRKNGYSSTTLNRYFGGKYTYSGINNYTSAKDTGDLLEKIYNGSLVSRKYSETMLGFLKNQNNRKKIPAGVSNGVVANKTGEIGGIQNDSAIVYTSGADYVISIMSETSSESKGIADIKKISNIVYKYYNK